MWTFYCELKWIIFLELCLFGLNLSISIIIWHDVACSEVIKMTNSFDEASGFCLKDKTSFDIHFRSWFIKWKGRRWSSSVRLMPSDVCSCNVAYVMATSTHTHTHTLVPLQTHPHTLALLAKGRRIRIRWRRKQPAICAKSLTFICKFPFITSTISERDSGAPVGGVLLPLDMIHS